MFDPLSVGIGGLFGLGGAAINAINQGNINERNAEMAREFAQNGVRWRVEDARRAGISPLAALGMSGSSGPAFAVGDNSVGDALSRMGQDVTRSATTTMSTEEKEMTALRIAGAKLDLEGKALENQIRASQLQKINQGPGMPGVVDIQPSKGFSQAPGRPAEEAATTPDVYHSQTDKGLAPMIPQQLSESLEDDWVGRTGWNIRNRLLPLFNTNLPSKSKLPKGYDEWRFNPGTMTFEPHKSSEWRSLPKKPHIWGGMRR